MWLLGVQAPLKSDTLVPAGIPVHGYALGPVPYPTPIRPACPLQAKRGEPPYSMDANLLHISYEGNALEDPWVQPPEDMFTLSVSPEKVGACVCVCGGGG